MTLHWVKTDRAFLPVPLERGGLLLRHLCVFLNGVAVAVLVVCGACREEPRLEHGRTSSAKGVAEEPEEVYLAPFIAGQGVPLVFYRHAWIHVEAREMGHELGVPFESEFIKPYSLELAIWRNGTIIWNQASDPSQPEHFEGTLNSATVHRLFAAIDAKRYRTAESTRYSEETRCDRDIPASMIAMLDGSKSFMLCSNLDQMELLKEYWYWHVRKEKVYPFGQYSFEQFSAEVPESYAQHLKNYAKLRGQLRSVIPKEGKKIDLHERIRWVLLPLVASGQVMPGFENTGVTGVKRSKLEQ